MMFLNCQKPGLIEGCVHLQTGLHHAGSESDAVRREGEGRCKILPVPRAAVRSIITAAWKRVVRINGLDTPHWKEDIRVCSGWRMLIPSVSAKTESCTGRTYR